MHRHREQNLHSEEPVKTMYGFTLAMFLASSVGALAQSAQFILVDRQQTFQQTDAATLAATGPLQMRVSLEGVTNPELITSATFTSPGGAGISGGTLTTDPNNHDSLRYENNYTQDPAGLTSMFSDFPAASYTVSVSNASTTVNVPVAQLGNGNFPNGSLVSLSATGGTWMNGAYYFNPSTGSTLDIMTSYSGPGTSNHGDLSISGMNVNLDNGGAFNAPSMSWSVPISSFTAGQSYDLELDWSNVVDFTPLSGTYDFLNGATAAGIFTGKTAISLVAVPEPANVACVLMFAAGLAALARRRIRAFAQTGVPSLG